MNEDQVLPNLEVLPLMVEQFNATLQDQIKAGLEEYGTPLKAFNGRDAFRDLAAEQIDAAMYSTQVKLEFATFVILVRRLSVLTSRLEQVMAVDDPDVAMIMAEIKMIREKAIACIKQSGFATSTVSLLPPLTN